MIDGFSRCTETPIQPERTISKMMRSPPYDATIISDPGSRCGHVSPYFQMPVTGHHFIISSSASAPVYALSGSLRAGNSCPDSKIVAPVGNRAALIALVCRALWHSHTATPLDGATGW